MERTYDLTQRVVDLHCNICCDGHIHRERRTRVEWIGKILAEDELRGENFSGFPEHEFFSPYQDGKPRSGYQRRKEID